MKLEASSLKRNKVDKPKVRFINNRRERAQINKIRNEKEEVKWTPQKYKGLQETTTSNYTPIK